METFRIADVGDVLGVHVLVCFIGAVRRGLKTCSYLDRVHVRIQLRTRSQVTRETTIFTHRVHVWRPKIRTKRTVEKISSHHRAKILRFFRNFLDLENFEKT